MTRAGSLAGIGDECTDREVLSSHPEIQGARTRGRISVIGLALATVLTVGLAADEAERPGLLVTTGHPMSHAGPSASRGETNLVALISTHCPRVRRLSLTKVQSVTVVEIAPCRRRSDLGQSAHGSGDVGSMHFARIDGSSPGTGGQSEEWIEVRCPSSSC